MEISLLWLGEVVNSPIAIPRILWGKHICITIHLGQHFGWDMTQALEVYKTQEWMNSRYVGNLAPNSHLAYTSELKRKI
jgi:hypothetical protein